MATLGGQEAVGPEESEKPTTDVPGAWPAKHVRVVVGVDGSPRGDKALEWAAEEARMRGAILEVVHAAFYRRELLEAFPGFAKGEGAVLARAVARARALAPTIEVVARMCEPPAAEALTKESEGATLLVVGSRGLHGFEELAKGSVSNYCVHYACCPVLVVRPTVRLEGSRHHVESPGALDVHLAST